MYCPAFTAYFILLKHKLDTVTACEGPELQTSEVKRSLTFRFALY